MLAVALTLDAAAGLLVGLTGLAELRPLPVHVTGLIVIYALLCSLGINDVVKTAMIARIGGDVQVPTLDRLLARQRQGRGPHQR